MEESKERNLEVQQAQEAETSAHWPQVTSRQWSTEQDGPHDRPVDIWYNGSWVPAFFKDIKAGDFFLILDHNLDPGKCFHAMSDCKRCGTANGHSNFIIMKGMEIVQAPTIKDITALNLENHKPKELK